jgi:solute:Na+ symporter, SSS family
LLGVFLLGTLTQRVRETAAIVGMACGVATNLLLWLAPRLEWVEPSHAIAWTWYVLIGTVVTVAVAGAVSMMSSNGASRYIATKD